MSGECSFAEGLQTSFGEGLQTPPFGRSSGDKVRGQTRSGDTILNFSELGLVSPERHPRRSVPRSLLVTIRKRSQVLDFTGGYPPFSDSYLVLRKRLVIITKVSG